MNQNEHVFPQARTTEIVTKDMPDEVLVYDLKTHKAHCLNQTAAAVWKYCNGQRTVADITQLIAQEQHRMVDEAAVWLAVERLSKANLLEERVTSPAGSPRLGRREAMRRLGLGSAVAVPIIMSIVAPTTASAATCGPANNNDRTNAPGCACGTSPSQNNSNDCISRCCQSSICVDKLPTGTPVSCPGSGNQPNSDCCSGTCNSANQCT